VKTNIRDVEMVSTFGAVGNKTNKIMVTIRGI